MKSELDQHKIFQNSQKVSIFLIVVSLLLRKFLPENTTLGIIFGSVYTFVTIRGYTILTNAILGGKIRYGVAAFVVIMKLGIIMLLIYFVSKLGEDFLWSALVGAFAFVPAVCFGTVRKRR